AAARARLRGRPGVRRLQGAGEAAGGAAARAVGVGEDDVLAGGAGDLEDAFDERLAVVHPNEAPAGLAADDGQSTIDVGAEDELLAAAGRAAALDERSEGGLGEDSHRAEGTLSSLHALSGLQAGRSHRGEGQSEAPGAP